MIISRVFPFIDNPRRTQRQKRIGIQYRMKSIPYLEYQIVAAISFSYCLSIVLITVFLNVECDGAGADPDKIDIVIDLVCQFFSIQKSFVVGSAVVIGVLLKIHVFSRDGRGPICHLPSITGGP